ncbi:hypothetical protein F5B17DRAFT_454234 [Nemania serpens]|nr:hypothetical protein F5B17DRAFT_454234 [Nemania serpens]
MSSATFLKNRGRRRNMNLDIGRLLGTGAAPVTQDVTTGHLGSSSVINNPNPTALFQDSGNTIVSPNHILTPYLPPLACLLEARALVEAKVEVTWPSSYIYDDAVHKYCLQSLKRPTPPGIHREISPSGLVLEVGNIDLTVTMCIPQEAGGWPRPHRFWVIPRPPGDTSGTEVIIGQDHPMVVNLTTQSGLMQGEVNNFFGGPSGQQSMGDGLGIGGSLAQDPSSSYFPSYNMSMPGPSTGQVGDSSALSYGYSNSLSYQHMDLMNTEGNLSPSTMLDENPMYYASGSDGAGR